MPLSVAADVPIHAGAARLPGLPSFATKVILMGSQEGSQGSGQDQSTQWSSVQEIKPFLGVGESAEVEIQVSLNMVEG